VSNSLLHHMDDPLDLWTTIRDCAAANAVVLVMDLIRPPSLTEAKNIIEKYAADEPEVLKADFLNSLRAAYRPAEIRAASIKSHPSAPTPVAIPSSPAVI